VEVEEVPTIKDLFNVGEDKLLACSFILQGLLGGISSREGKRHKARRLVGEIATRIRLFEELQKGYNLLNWSEIKDLAANYKLLAEAGIISF